MKKNKKATWGGGIQSCVFNCFDYLDDERHDAFFYYETTLTFLGYTPDGRGGVHTSDIGKIGAFGGFKVTEITSDFSLKANGLTSDGCKVMMTFNDEKTGIDHAVVVIGYEYNKKGELCLRYHDPTTGKKDVRVITNYSGLYKVDYQPKDSSSPSGTTGEEGGSGISNH